MIRYREIHTCPRCGCNHEIPSPSLQMQSVHCPECAAIVAAEQREYGGLTMAEAMTKAGIDGAI